MNDIQKEIAEKYQEFFNFMNQEHELILTMEEMDEIVFEAQRLFKKLTIPAVSICSLPDCNKEVSKNSNTLCIEHAYQRKMQGYCC